ncbi:unnamed protein product [Ambrosiozyma monospora]|uniref:Unnamed protein product n=1 Tax=Ambrosiozyma monospora TaxID=43982 RepID=A0ACB5SVY1_AMBMO|nr:unnamed protein product [Ambrosiozyma monospora]
MSGCGCIIRADNWKNGGEEQYLAVNPPGDTVLLYQTNSTRPRRHHRHRHHGHKHSTTSVSISDDDEDYDENSILKQLDRTGFEGIQCIDYSRTNYGLTAVGQIDGSVAMFDIFNEKHSLLKMSPRQYRSCNSVSFNDQGLIAMGYDRGRQDHSIQIWDINNYSKTANNDHIKKPLSSFIPHEVIHSVKFYPDSPTALIAGSTKSLREFDTRSHQAAFQISTRNTLNISINPFRHYIFATHSQDGTLALWDRRKITDGNGHATTLPGSRSGSFSTSGHNHHSNSGPFHTSSSMSSVLGGAIVATTTPAIPQYPNTIFSASPVLQFDRLIDEQRKSGVGAPYKFSPFVNGEMSALITPEVIRRWRYDVVPPLPSEVDEYKAIVTREMQENPSFNPIRAGVQIPEERLYVATIHDVMTKYERVIAFDYACNLSAPYGIDLVCMRQSGSVYKMSVVETQTAIAFNSHNDLTFSGAVGTCTKLINDIEELKLAELKKVMSGVGASDDEERGHDGGDAGNEKGGNKGNADATVGIGMADRRDSMDSLSSSDSDLFISTSDSMHLTSDALLENDICSTIWKRAKLGYSTFANKNMDVLDNIKSIGTQGQLRNTWKWIDISYGLIAIKLDSMVLEESQEAT